MPVRVQEWSHAPFQGCVRAWDLVPCPCRPLSPPEAAGPRASPRAFRILHLPLVAAPGTALGLPPRTAPGCVGSTSALFPPPRWHRAVGGLEPTFLIATEEAISFTNPFHRVVWDLGRCSERKLATISHGRIKCPCATPLLSPVLASGSCIFSSETFFWQLM